MCCSLRIPLLGNGIIDTIEHIIYVKPDKFEWKHTWQIASELEKLNERRAA